MITSLAIQEIPTKDCCFLRLADNSYYNPDFPVENGILEILTPGAPCAKYFSVEPYFNTSFNSSSLELITPGASEATIPLPDGIYNIKYSVKPNNFLVAEYYLMRTCKLDKKYADEVCKLWSEKNSLCKEDFNKKKDELDYIRFLIDSSKFLVEEKTDLRLGAELYAEADRLIKIYNGTQC